MATAASTLSTLDFTGDEFQSYEAFVEYLLDEDRDECKAGELQALAARLRLPVKDVRATLEGAYGVKLADRLHPVKARGFNTSSNDRWYGPGSSPSHGGSGWEEITGMAGRRG